MCYFVNTKINQTKRIKYAIFRLMINKNHCALRSGAILVTVILPIPCKAAMYSTLKFLRQQPRSGCGNCSLCYAAVTATASVLLLWKEKKDIYWKCYCIEYKPASHLV